MKQSFLSKSSILFILFFAVSAYSLDSQRSEKWAVPLSKPGLKNFFKVSETLYRGAKPTTEGIAELKKLGIKTIVNLELFHSDRKKIEKSKTGLNYVHLFVNTLDIKEEQIVQFLKIMIDANQTPVFLHCYHGSDRTGTFTAAYRIVIEGWTKEQAIDELKNGGFGYHKMFKNLIQFLNQMDVEKIKEQVYGKKN